jgi:glycosyltransferase involved in cell wall biosynthesis
MRIGLFIDVFYPMIDGVVKVVDEYARRLSKEHKVFVICPKTSDHAYQDDFPYEVIRVVKIKIPNTDYDIAIPQLDAKLQKTLKTLHLDIVHMHSPFSMGELALTYAKKYQVPCVATLHSQYKKDFYDRTKSHMITQVMLADIMKRVDRSDLVITMNEGSKKLYKNYELKSTPRLIPNATEMTYLMGQKHVDKIKKTYHMSDDTFNMIFVGRIDKIKNLTFLFEALAKLKKFHKKMHLYLIGQGAHINFYEDLAERLQIQEHVTFVGAIYDRSELAAWYEIVDLLTFPSTYDTNGLVQYEAASQKTPSLMIEHTLASSEIIPDVNGYTTKEDPLLYAKKIVQIIENTTQHQKVSEQAYMTLYHHWDDIVSHIENIYKELIHG